jgi:hypothetical protein
MHVPRSYPKDRFDSLDENAATMVYNSIDWGRLAMKKNLPKSLILSFFKELSGEYTRDFYINNVFDLEIIEKNLEHIHWRELCSTSITEEIISKYEDKIIWNRLDLRKFNLTENQIDLVLQSHPATMFNNHFESVAKTQNLSLDYIKRYMNEFKLKDLLSNKKLEKIHAEIKQLYENYRDLI